MQDKPFAINFFAGPSVGKTTIGMAVASLLKMHGINVEFISEFPKELVYEGRELALENQSYVWAKQFHRLFRVRKQVEGVVTDSPMMLYEAYSQDFVLDLLPRLIRQSVAMFQNFNFFLERVHPYKEGEGRYQNEEDAIVKDIEIRKILEESCAPFTVIQPNFTSANYVASTILAHVYNRPLEIWLADTPYVSQEMVQGTGD